MAWRRGPCGRLRRRGLTPADVVRVVRAALDEDFRYGPDVTSAATVAGRTVTADVVAREAGRGGRAAGGARGARPARRLPGGGQRVGRGAATGGAGGCRRRPAGRGGGRRRRLSRTGRGSGPGTRCCGFPVTPSRCSARSGPCSTSSPTCRASPRPPGPGRTPSPGPGPWSGTPARRCPGCGGLRSTRCGAAAARTTGWALGDAALVKDNHVAAAGGVAAAVRAVRAAARPGLVIEVECDSVAQVREALAAGARFILLDNMPVPSCARRWRWRAATTGCGSRRAAGCGWQRARGRGDRRRLPGGGRAHALVAGA